MPDFPIVARSAETTVDVTVSAPYSGDGVAVDYSDPSTSVSLHNTSYARSFGEHDALYRVDDGPWLVIPPGGVRSVSVDLSTQTLTMKRGQFASDAAISMTVTGVPSGLYTGSGAVRPNVTSEALAELGVFSDARAAASNDAPGDSKLLSASAGGSASDGQNGQNGGVASLYAGDGSAGVAGGNGGSCDIAAGNAGAADTSSAGTPGSLTLRAGTGGDSATGNPSAGAFASLNAGNGGSATDAASTHNGGNGSPLTLAAGSGGSAEGSGDGGNGAYVQISAGDSGSANGSGRQGVPGDVYINSGDGGAGNINLTGLLYLFNLPTSNAGLSAGQVYVDAGVLKIVTA